MISFDYATAQLAAVWRMAWNQESWRTDLDLSVNGVFRSFGAILFAAPFALFSFIALRRSAPLLPQQSAEPLTTAPLVFSLFVNGAAFVLDWALSIGIIIIAARLLDAGNRVSAAIIGFNWSQVFISAAQAIPLALLLVTQEPAIGGVASMPVLGFVLVLLWGVFRRSIAETAGAAIAVILAIAIVGLTASFAVSRIALSLLQLLS